jgi:CHASE3 domain sensor protein
MKHIELIGFGISFILTALFANPVYLLLTIVCAVLYSIKRWQSYTENVNQEEYRERTSKTIGDLYQQLETLKNDQSRLNDQILIMNRGRPK